MPRGAPFPGPDAYKSTQRVAAPERYARGWFVGGAYPGATDATPEPSAPTATGRSPTHPCSLGAYTWGLGGLGYRNAAFVDHRDRPRNLLGGLLAALGAPRGLPQRFCPETSPRAPGTGVLPPGCCTLMGVASALAMKRVGARRARGCPPLPARRVQNTGFG